MAEAKTDKTIPIGTENLVVRDDKAVSAFVDGITEMRISNGVCYVSFCQVVMDGTNPPELDVCVRLRMTVEMMEKVHAAFSRQVDAVNGINKPTSN